MHFIIGGAYQGKLTFAKDAYHLTSDQVFSCTEEGEINFSFPCLTHIEHFTYGCTLRGMDPISYFKQHRQAWKNSIFICRDIFCGLVPMDAKARAWREETGQLCQYLASEAQSVSRIFFGLEQRLK